MNRVIELVNELALNLNTVPQVLVVEDDTDDLFLMARSLEKFGCEVFTARDGATARALIEQRILENPAFPVDVVFLDLKLDGEEDGATVMAYIRGRAPKVPIVIVTGGASPSVMAQVVKIGYFGFITKPLEPLTIASIFQHHRIPFNANKESAQ